MPRKLLIYPIILFILVMTMACGFSFGDSEPEPTSTQAAVPTREEVKEEPEEETIFEMETSVPTKAPVPVSKATEVEMAPAFEIDPMVYENPSGAFQLNPPLGWTIDEDEYGGTSWISPDEVGYMYVAVTNTGYPLDEVSFKSFIDGYEQNTFAYYENYEILETDEQYADNYVWVKKNLDYEGLPQYVASYYHLLGQGVYTVDYWADMDESESYIETYNIVHQSIQMDNTPVPNLPIYHWVTTFTDRYGLYQITIPRPWYYTTEEDTNLYIDSFLSPDEYGLIENMTYDDGEVITKGDAGRIALYLLNNYYTSGSGDIKVTGDKVQPDGSERLDWTSRAGGYHGQSFFETRGTTFLMFSTIYTEGYDFFNEPFNMVISSYSVE